MPSLATHRITLESLGMLALARGFLRHRNPRRRQAAGHRKTFNERAWREAAERLGATSHPLGSGICEIRRNGFRTRVMDNISAIDDPVTLALLHDKPLTHRILSDVGLQVPRHARFTIKSMAPAIEFLRAARGACVVKPAAGTGGGAGVATGVATQWQLARAAAAASIYCDDLLIEEQIAGENYRLLYLDGELIDAYARRRPTVVADGRSTVAQLVRRTNESRLRAGDGISQGLLTVDVDMRRTLAQQGLSLRTVPPNGKTVTLKTAVNENAGGDNTTVMSELSPSIVADGERAVRTLGVRFAGVDVVTPNHMMPLADAGGVILEINGTPNLYFHYHKKDGCFPAALHALARLLPDSSPKDHCQAPPRLEAVGHA